LKLWEPFVEGWEENQCFSLNSQLTALNSSRVVDANFYPAMFEITGGIPEPIFDEPQEAESLGEHGRP
jgi:hypothetical protein